MDIEKRRIATHYSAKKIIENGDCKDLKLLFDREMTCYVPQYSIALFYDAIRSKRLEMVRLFIEYNFDSSSIIYPYLTPLEFTIRSGTPEIFQFLIESGEKYEKEKILKFIYDENRSRYFSGIQYKKEIYLQIMEEFEGKRGNIKPAEKEKF